MTLQKILMQIDLDQVECMEKSSITVRNYRRRTTVPSGIFDFLKLKDKDQLKWLAMKDGNVIIRKIEGEKE